MRLTIAKPSREAQEACDDFAHRIEQLSGIKLPPANSAGWSAILIKAGFSAEFIERFLATIGSDGFAECGELPHGYFSASGGDLPTFSAALLAGLEQNARCAPRAPDPSPEAAKQIRPTGQVVAVIRAIEAGETNGAISDRFGRSVGSVRQIRSKHKHGRYTL